eukprot:XP_011243826.1 PREDICTED: ran GTPase-activating protein 1 isoform X2 [Mus musculus]
MGSGVFLGMDDLDPIAICSLFEEWDPQTERCQDDPPVYRPAGEPATAAMASEDIAKLAETLAKTQVAGGQLSFKGKGLKLNTAEDAKDVIKEIEEFDGLEALRLEGNTVGVEAARVIAKALEKKSELKRCHWSDMFTGRLRSEIPPALISLGEGLITAGAQLVELDLSDNAFGPDGVRGFEALLKSPACFTLQELKLNNCGMGIGGGKILAAALTECHRKSSAQGKPLALKVFVAGRNRLENDGATALAEAFGTLKTLRQVEVINFGDCLVRSKGAVAIADAVRGGLPKLKELNLSFCEIKRDAALVVAEAVADKAELEKLDLNGNALGEEGCEQLQEVMDSFNMAKVLASLSDDEGEDEDEEEEGEEDDEEEEDEEDEEDDDEEEEEQEEEEEPPQRGSGEEPATPSRKILDPNSGEPAPVLSSPTPTDLSTFLSFPSPEKLLRLGPKVSVLIVQQTDTSDPEKVVSAFLKVASVFRDDASVKTAVLDAIDALMKKAFSCSSFNSNTFLTRLLIHMGLLKSEDKIKAIPSLHGPLMVLNHVVRQDYFPKALAPLLLAFVTKPNGALETCSFARHNLLQTLYNI